MIFESLGNAVFGVLEWFFSFMPEISWDVDIGVADFFFDLLDCVFFLLPMQVVIVLFGIVVNILIFKVIISVLKTIWEILPLA